MSAVVRADGVTKRWGATVALDAVNLTIGTGVTGLLGANGAGKTTLIGMVLGLHRPDAGMLEVLGRDPWTAGPEVRARLGYSPEHESLPTDMRAHDFVRHLAELHGIPHNDAVARASDALYEVGLGEERFRPLGTMSTGQKQRVKLAQAIAHDPALVLLDEPTNGLDPVQRDQMLALVRRCGHELGLNIVMCSHLLDEVERTCDDVIILANGKTSGGGAIEAMHTQSNDLLVEIDGSIDAFLGTPQMQSLQARVEGRNIIVEFVSDLTYDAIRDAAVESGVGLRSLRRRTSTLEDAFLEASA